MRGLTSLRFLLLALFVVAMTACGSGDEPSPAAQPTLLPVPTATSVPPTATPKPALATNSAPDAVTEAELLEKAERALTAFIDKDWDTFLDSCAKDSRPSRNVENLEEEHVLHIGSVKPEDVSVTEFAVFRPTRTPLVPPAVSVEFDVNFAGKFIGRAGVIWTIENGQWVNKDCNGAGGG